jgi:hypothetical protein
MNKFIILSILIIMSFSINQLHAQRGRMVQRYLEKSLSRDAAPNKGPVPDYSDLNYWAASPYKHDTSDSIPAFVKDEKRDKKADVFFIHPTSYVGIENENEILEPGVNRKEILNKLKTLSWNADLTDNSVNSRTDYRTILYQATAFNADCRIFAPRDRQANIKAFFVRSSPQAQKAFDLAYGDIRKAFEYYLKNENHGRPVIIASHSQGSMHAIRLLQEFFDGKPLQHSLVCAYIIGYRIPVGTFSHIPIGNTADATGCYVGWRSYPKGELSGQIKNEAGNSVCVNPLTWNNSTAWASESLNKGSLFGFNKMFPHAVGAGIESGSNVLWVSLPDEVGGNIKKMKNLHIMDYNLFWMNIRENVRQRIDAYFRENK